MARLNANVRRHTNGDIVTARSFLLLLLPSALGVELLLVAWLFWVKRQGWGEELIGIAVFGVAPALFALLAFADRIKRTSTYQPTPTVVVTVCVAITAGIVGLLLALVSAGRLDALPLACGLYVQFGVLVCAYLYSRA